MAFFTCILIGTAGVACSVARSADSGFWVDELIHSTVAKTAIIRVAVVTGEAAFVGYEVTEVAAVGITPVVEIVHKSFKVVDHTEGGSKIEFNISVGEDNVFGDDLSLVDTVDI